MGPQKSEKLLPRIDFGRCWIFEVGRPIRSGSPMIAGGAALAVLGALALAFRFSKGVAG